MSTDITSKNLILSHLKKEDLQEFYKHFRTDSEYKLMTGLEYDESHNEFFAKTLEKPLYYKILLKNPHTQIIGYIGLEYNSDPNSAELDIYIFSEHRNSGYGFEASLALFGRIFDEANPEINSIEATAFTRNIPCCKLLEKIGFQSNGEAIAWYVPVNDKDKTYNLEDLQINSYTLSKEIFHTVNKFGSEE